MPAQQRCKRAFYGGAEPWQPCGAGWFFFGYWFGQGGDQRDDKVLGAGDIFVDNAVALRRNHVQGFLLGGDAGVDLLGAGWIDDWIFCGLNNCRRPL